MGKILSAFWKNKGNVGLTILLVILGIGIMVILPFVVIFALRMMGLGIGYTLETWFGAFILLALFHSGGSSKKD
jgi:hypothetical protein